MNKFRRSHSRAITFGDKLWQNGTNWHQRHRQQPLFRHLSSLTDAVFCFGKYCGKNVMEVNDFQYMIWVTGKFSLQPFQRFVLESKLILDLRKILVKLEQKNTMNPQKKTLSFATAVLDTVCDFTNRNENFSAYDVTRLMRDRVNKGELELLDGTSIVLRGKKTTSIPHYTKDGVTGVQEIVHDIFRNNDVSDYEGKPEKNYTLYTYTPPFTAVVKTADSSTSYVAQSTPVAGTDVNQIIFTYVATKNASGVRPTLKQIQSALRRRGNFTCKDLETSVNSLGLKLSLSNDGLSKSEVYI